MSYTVGQVIYVVLKKETRVYPMMISEQLTRKTLEGEQISYMVRGGADEQSQLLITEIDGEIFDSAEKARVVLIDRAKNSITRLVDNAVQKAKEWYPSAAEIPNVDPMTMLKKSSNLQLEQMAESVQSDDEPVMIQLPDGKFGKVRSVKSQ
jgi:hypothetical protein